MTKKEQTEFDQLKHELALAKALRWTVGEVKRDVPPPTGFMELSKGWDFNAYSRKVYKACSSSINHGDGWVATNTQKPLWLFSTPALAYAALRRAVEREAAINLLAIDDAAQQHTDKI